MLVLCARIYEVEIRLCIGKRHRHGHGHVTYHREESHVPPGWGLLILSHEFHVDIGFLGSAVVVLLPDLLAIVQIRVHN